MCKCGNNGLLGVDFVCECDYNYIKEFAVAFPTSKFITTYTFQIPPPGNKRHHQAMMVMSHPFLQ